MDLRLLILGLIIFLVPYRAISQNSLPVSVNYTLKGILLDSLTNEGEPYATIRIALKSQPDKALKMAVTDVNGKFNEKLNTPVGEYSLNISSIGKRAVSQVFTVKSETKQIDLGTLFTQDATEELQGVEVIAQKPLVKVDMDKIEYNIEDDPDSKSSNVLDMLRKVPLVTVDGEDKVQVNGSSSFKIHVNGKPNNMMSNNPTEVLKSMPANSIKYIEVITEPGVKYDAEGVGGILNIVTIGGGMEGYTATFNGRASNNGVGAGAYATVQAGKFTVTGNYSYNYNKSPKSYSESFRENYDLGDENKYLTSSGSSKNTGNYQYGNMEGSYEIDTLRLITFSANMYGGSYDGSGLSRSTMTDVEGNETYHYNMLNDQNFSYKYIGASVDYQRSFKKKGELLTFSYRLNDNPRESDYTVSYSDIYNYPYDLADLKSSEDANTIEHTFQADYANLITKIHELETGIKYIIRNSKSDSRNAILGEDGGSSALNVPDDLKYKHQQDILAAYGGYRLKLKKFSAKAGIRYEHTFMDVEYATSPKDNFNANFDDVVPSINLSYQLAQSKTLRASYNMRISRPGIWYLSPYVNRTNPDNISFGNPDLDTEKSHTFGINFNSFSQKINLDLGLRHTFTDNSIERFSYLGTDEDTGRENVMHNTYRNMGKYNNTRLSVYFNWNIGPKTRFYVNGGGNYIDIKNDALDISNSGFGYNCYAGLQHTLPWKLRLSLNGGGSGQNVSSQGSRSGYYYYSIGLNRQFLKERLTVSVNTSNPFEKYRTFENKTTTSTFYSYSKNKHASRYIGLNISYRIGELKATVKKAARSIQNDDTKSGGDSNSGSGQS